MYEHPCTAVGLFIRASIYVCVCECVLTMWASVLPLPVRCITFNWQTQTAHTWSRPPSLQPRKAAMQSDAYRRPVLQAGLDPCWPPPWPLPWPRPWPPPGLTPWPPAPREPRPARRAICNGGSTGIQQHTNTWRVFICLYQKVRLFFSWVNREKNHQQHAKWGSLDLKTTKNNKILVKSP